MMMAIIILTLFVLCDHVVEAKRAANLIFNLCSTVLSSTHCFRIPAASVLVRLLGHSDHQQNAPYYQVFVIVITRLLLLLYQYVVVFMRINCQENLDKLWELQII